MSSIPSLPTILVIEDDLDVAEMLDSYFNMQGYEVKTANWGEDGLKSAKENCPDLVILDIRLPDIDGFEVAERLRAYRTTAAVPIIFLTEKRQRQDRLRGLEVGGDDYITKPFDIQELRLRVQNALHRSSQTHTRNPITELPEGKLVDEHLASNLSQPDWAILSVKLDNLDKFRDQYGFISADDALRATSLLILNTLRETGNPNDFLGHLASNIFVATTSPEKIDGLTADISNKGILLLGSFYPTKDLEKTSDAGQPLELTPVQFLSEKTEIQDLNSFKAVLLNQKEG